MSTLMDQTMGALLCGVVVAAVFYGVSVSQIYYYFTRYPKDHWGTKLLVAAVWTTDTIHQALITHSVYWYLVTEYGKPLSLGLLVNTIIIEVLFNAFTGLFVQSFFAHRIWRLSEGKLYLVIPVCCFVIGEFAVSVAYTVKALRMTTFAELVEIKGLSLSINALAAGGDVLIAIIMCTLLQQQKTGFRRTTTLINKLMVFTINTGLATSVCACLSLITITTKPDTFIYILFFFNVGRLYNNSLMATLNSRKRLSEGSSSAEGSVSLQNIPPSGASRGGFNATKDGIAIRIETTSDRQHSDHEYGSQKRAYEAV